MSESPFVTISRIINEPANISDDLRIIAGDHGRFTDDKRQILRNAAEELDGWQRAYALLQVDLIEAQRRLIAVNEQLIESRKSQPKWSMSGTISGTITPLMVPGLRQGMSLASCNKIATLFKRRKSMAKNVTPKPMPTTGQPGVVRPIPWNDWRPPAVMGQMAVNPGKPPSNENSK